MTNHCDIFNVVYNLKNSNISHRHIIYRKLLGNYFALIFFTVFLLSAILYSSFTSRNKKDIEQYSINILEQTLKTTDVMLEQIDNIHARIISNPRSINILYGDNTDYGANYAQMSEFSDICAINSFISGIALYNGNTGYFLYNYPINDAIKAIVENENKEFTKQITLIDNPKYSLTRNKESILTYIVNPNYIQREKPSSIIFFFNIDYLNTKMSNLSLDEQICLITDSSGQTLFNSDNYENLDKSISDGIIDEVLNSEKISDYLTISGNLVTYIKTDKNGWTYISLIPNSKIFAGQWHVLYQIIAISVILIILGYIITVIFLNKLYKPIDSLLNNIILTNETKTNEFQLLQDYYSNNIKKLTSMESTIKNAYKVIKRSYFNFLLNNDKSNSENIINLFERLQQELIGPYYCVVILKLEFGTDLEAEVFDNDEQLYLEKSAGLLFNAKIATSSRDRIVIICQAEEPEINAFAYKASNDLQTQLKQDDYVVTISIGVPAHSINALSNSYYSAIKNLGLRFFYGRGAIITPEKAQKHNIPLFEYPADIERHIVQSINTSDTAKLDEYMDSFEKQLLQTNVQNAISCIKQLYNNVCNVFTTETVSFENLTTDNTLNETISYIYERFTAFCKDYSHSRTKKNMDFCDEMIKYIDLNYSNSFLSMQEIADHFSVSISHVSRILRTYHSTSFVNYITNLRMEHAYNLVVETNMSISEICQKTGINSTNYFHTLFKKKYGTTPKLCRLNYKTNKL